MIAISTDFVLDALSLASFSTSEDAKQILERVIEIYEKSKLRKNQVAIDTDMDVFFEIIKELVYTDINLDRKTERNKIILKVKTSPLAQKDRMIADNVAEMLRIGAEQGLSRTKERILIKKLQNWALISSTNDKLLEGLALCRKYSNTDETQNDLILMNMLDKASEITKIQDNIIGVSESLDELDFSSKQSMEANAIKYVQRKKKNIIHLGLQGLNRMMGPNNGVARGELFAFGGSSHDGKSYLLMNVARWATVYNKYELNDPSKTPTILFITLENETSDNYNDMSISAYVNANHRPVPPDMTREALIDINYAYYNKLGNKLVMKRFGDDFGYSDLLKLIAKMEMRGMEIVALIIDYPALMRQEQSDKDNAAKILERLFQKLMDLSHAKDIATFVGVQLGTEADRLYSSGEIMPVKKLGASAIGDSRGLRRALDILVFHHIEVVDGVSYMTFAWNKHRNNPSVPAEDKCCAYKFIDTTLGIMDDLGGKDVSIKDIYADVAKDNEPEQDKKEEDFFSQIQQV